MNDDETDGGGPVTPEELAEARARWADPSHTPEGSELFGRAVAEDGFLGDVPLAPPDLAPLIGERVTAKRLGWDDGEAADDDPDHTPYPEMGYDSPDLSGVLTRLRFDLPDGTPAEAWEVGGQPADPKTVRPAGEDEDSEEDE